MANTNTFLEDIAQKVGNDKLAMKWWENFYNLSQVPRSSGNEGKIRDYLIDQAKQRGHEFEVDSVGNLLIRQRGEGNYMALQSHMDMVMDVADGVTHDFDNDPIQMYVEGDWVKARGTTLGADNGAGIATSLVLMDSPLNIEHIFTVEEESTFKGAENLNFKLMSTKMINLDSEEDGIIYNKSAGGIVFEGLLKANKDFSFPSGNRYCSLEVSGLPGGHSGVDIQKSENGNAYYIGGKLLKVLRENSGGIHLVEVSGGKDQMMNKIPKSFDAKFVMSNEEEYNMLNSLVESASEELQKECPGLNVKFKISEHPVGLIRQYDSDITNKIIDMLSENHSGVFEWEIKDKLPSVSNTWGVLKTNDEGVYIVNLIRGTYEEDMKKLYDEMATMYDKYGVGTKITRNIAPWHGIESGLLQTAREQSVKIFGEAVVASIHAGLEAGAIAEIYKEKGVDLEVFSTGPLMEDVHTCAEKLSIYSPPKVQRFVEEVIKNS